MRAAGAAADNPRGSAGRPAKTWTTKHTDVMLGGRRGLALLVCLPVLAGPIVLLGDTTPALSEPSQTADVDCVSPFTDSDPGDMPLQDAMLVEDFNLELVAKRYGKTVAALTASALDEPSLYVAECGELFYIDPAAPTRDNERRQQLRSPAPMAAKPSNSPRSSTPIALSSRPKSERTIFLDFRGTDLAGTYWIGRDSLQLPVPRFMPGLDLDGDPSTFTDQENALIADIFENLVGYFANFDVNITTQDPGWQAITRSSPTDATYGSTMYFVSDDSASNSWRRDGIAPVGAINRVQEGQVNRFPGLVFLNDHLRNSRTARLALVAAHELGHLFGLEHHGLTIPYTAWPPYYCSDPSSVMALTNSTLGRPGAPVLTAATNCDYYAGHKEWAPVMGNGGRWTELSQWSSGRFVGLRDGETSRRPDQDDLAVMALKGLVQLSDIGADTISTAIPMQGESRSGGRFTFSNIGLIQADGDVDLHSFLLRSWSEISLLVEGAEGSGPWPTVRILDRLGQEVGFATADPEPQSTTSIEGVLPTGRYYVEVKGGGKAGLFGPDFNIGLYRITVQANQTTVPSVLEKRITVTQGARVTAGQITNQVGGLTWGLQPGSSLPPGLRISPRGALTGTPTRSGEFTASVRGLRNGGLVLTVDLTIAVAPPLRLTPTFAPTLYRDSGAYEQYVMFRVSGGTPPYEHRLVVTPNRGANLGPQPVTWYPEDNSDLVIVRVTPRTARDTIRLGLTVIDARGARTARIMTLSVADLPRFPDEGTITLTPAAVGVPYDQVLPIPGGGVGQTRLRASGVSSRIGGSGLRFDSVDNRITGTLVRNYEDFILSGTAEDSLGRRVSVTYRLPISTSSAPSLDSVSLPIGNVGQGYSASVSVSGGEPPVRVTVSGLPGGLTFDRRLQSIRGTPTTSGTFPVTFAARDLVGRTAERIINLTILEPDSGESELPASFAAIFPVPSGVTWDDVEVTPVLVGAEGRSPLGVSSLGPTWKRALVAADWNVLYETPPTGDSAMYVLSRDGWQVTLILDPGSPGSVISLSALNSSAAQRR